MSLDPPKTSTAAAARTAFIYGLWLLVAGQRGLIDFCKRESDTKLDGNAESPDSASTGKQTILASRDCSEIPSATDLASDIRNFRDLLHLVKTEVTLKLNAVEKRMIYYPSSTMLLLYQQAHSIARSLSCYVAYSKMPC
jgi:hypothetical protein